MLTPPAEDPVLIKLEELDQRLQAIERVMENQSLVQLTQQVDAAGAPRDELQGNRRRWSTMRRRRPSGSVSSTPISTHASRSWSASAQSESASVLDGGTLQPGELPIPGGSDRDNYQVALELLQRRALRPVRVSFQQFLVTFPDSELADNAQYWLAESYYVDDSSRRRWRTSSRVIENYPQSRKVPDALLKMGYCNYSLQRWDDARTRCRVCRQTTRTTTAARLADQYLKRMESEGV